MKILLSRALDAVLNADLRQARADVASQLEAPIEGDHSRPLEISTRLGPIKLVAGTDAACRRAERIRTRYAFGEHEILLMLGHMIVRAHASACAARALGEKLCGHKLRDHSVRAIQERLNVELDELNRREMARIRLEEATAEMNSGQEVASGESVLYPSSPALSNSGFPNRIWNWSPTLAAV